MNFLHHIICKIQRNLSGETWQMLDRELLHQEHKRFMISQRIRCKMGKHSFYQSIGGYDTDGLPYPAKSCHFCDYNEDLR